MLLSLGPIKGDPPSATGCRKMEKNDFSKNALLAALQDHGDGRPDGIALVDLTTHESLYEAGGPMESVFFPIDAVISVVTTLADGTSVRLAASAARVLRVYLRLSARRRCQMRRFVKWTADVLSWGVRALKST